jgi:TRAP-type uncharacterized transport system substrate-binding protein
LRDDEKRIDVGLVRGGIGDAEEAPHLVSLGVVGYEVLWVFCHGRQTLDDLPGLRGKTVAIGGKGAGMRRLVRTLLAANGIDEGEFKALEIGGLEAAEALLTKKADCAFLMEPPESGLLKALIYSDSAQLVDFRRRADAYTKLMPALHKVVLPEGANDQPGRGIDLLAQGLQCGLERTQRQTLKRGGGDDAGGGDGQVGGLFAVGLCDLVQGRHGG